MTTADDPHADVKRHAATPEMLVERRVGRVPTKIQKQRRRFVMVPWFWIEGLKEAPGHTYQLALHLLFQNWRQHGGWIKLPNGMLKIDGVSRYSKWRGLAELERRGLVEVQRRSRKSPLVRLNMLRS